MEPQPQIPQNKQSTSQTNQATNSYELLVKLSWLLAVNILLILKGLSVIACLIRNDYNVLFSFFILVVLHNFYNENSFFYSKTLIHLTSVMILIDILWLIIITPLWTSKIDMKNDYWGSLSGIHSFTLFIAFLELINKSGILFLFIFDFKKFNGDKYSKLFDFNYSEASPKVLNSILYIIVFLTLT